MVGETALTVVGRHSLQRWASGAMGFDRIETTSDADYSPDNQYGRKEELVKEVLGIHRSTALVIPPWR